MIWLFTLIRIPTVVSWKTTPALHSRLQAVNVVYITPKFCEPALYDYMIYKTMLDKHNIPYLHLEYKESTSSFNHARTTMETFAELIMFD